MNIKSLQKASLRNWHSNKSFIKQIFGQSKYLMAQNVASCSNQDSDYGKIAIISMRVERYFRTWQQTTTSRIPLGDENSMNIYDILFSSPLSAAASAGILNWREKSAWEKSQ